jgi:hypothetical protein
VLLGSIIRFPYSPQQDLRVRKSVNITRFFAPKTGQTSDYPLFDNGSLREISFSPFESKVYYKTSESYLPYNDSFLQIDFGRAGALTFGIAELFSWEGNHNIKHTLFNFSLDAFQTDRIKEWRTYVWTSPYSYSYFTGPLGLIFQNPTDQDSIFAFNVTFHYYAEEQITLYNTLLDPNFAYVGIVMIGISIPLNAYPFIKNRELENSAKKIGI